MNIKKCIYCHRNIKVSKNLIAFYEEKTTYLWHFCSWWHVVRWHIRRKLKGH